VARQAATSSLSGLMLPARIVGSRRVSNRALVGGVRGNVSCMVVAVSSWPRRSSSAHRICIRPQCPCGAATEATLHTQAGPCSWAAVATQCGPRETPRRVVSQLYAQCRGRLRGDTATRFDLTLRGGGREEAYGADNGEMRRAIRVETGDKEQAHQRTEHERQLTTRSSDAPR
jgi:hypothetical protein